MVTYGLPILQGGVVFYDGIFLRIVGMRLACVMYEVAGYLLLVYFGINPYFWIPMTIFKFCQRNTAQYNVESRGLISARIMTQP